MRGRWRDTGDGASGTRVIPRVVGTVEDIVNDLKGGSGILLVYGVQVGPQGDGDGRGGHFQTVSFNFRDCSNVGNSLLYW